MQDMQDPHTNPNTDIPATPEGGEPQAAATQPGRIGSRVAKARRPRRAASLFDPAITRRAIGDSFKKLDPRLQAKNPVMFVVEIGSVVTTIEFVRSLIDSSLANDRLFIFGVTVWLWFTVLFANFAEAMAEGRGKAQADTLRRARTETSAKRLSAKAATNGNSLRTAAIETIAAPQLRKDDLVLVEAGDFIPSDGEVVEGVASVDESAITGESAPVIRESGGDRSAVTGGTRVLSDWVVVRVTSNPGETFLDRMIALVEGANRQKTPNEIALNILLAVLTLIFLLAVVTLEPFGIYSGGPVSITALIALLVCLIPTTIGGLLSSIGIAGMDRLVQRNVLAMSGRAVEAAGDVDVLLLDKTGTITLGNRMASEFIPVSGVTEQELAEAALLSSIPDETPEGRSIVVLAHDKYKLDGHDTDPTHMTLIPFSATTRMSGVDFTADGANPEQQIRKGAGDAVRAWVSEGVGAIPTDLLPIVERIAHAGGTPLVVAERQRSTAPRILGVIYLKDVVKSGMSERFDELRKMGIRTVMITGDNPLTAAAIAGEAGVDDFLAQATPETKMKLIREQQTGGRLVAMTGDGTNDAPGAGAGRRRRGDEQRHAGGQRGWQHGGPRLESHQADRDCRGRQAAADDARRANDLQHRQRRGQVLRHHPGGLRGHLPAVADAQHHAIGDATQRGALGGDLQRADHRRADPAGPTRREVSPARRRDDPAPQPADLRPGRHHLAVHRHQADRSDSRRAAPDGVAHAPR